MAYGDGPMGIFLVCATENLRAKVSSTCKSFYMPFEHVAVVSYNGSAEELARRLDVDRVGGPGVLAHCLRSKRAVAMRAGGVLAVIGAVRICQLLI